MFCACSYNFPSLEQPDYQQNECHNKQNMDQAASSSGGK